jgi:hypothetical protein
MLTHVKFGITMGDDMLARLFKTIPNGLVEVHCTSALFAGSADMFYATCHWEDFKWDIIYITRTHYIYRKVEILEK